MVPDEQAPDELFVRDRPIDVAPWRAKGIEMLVRTQATALAGGKIELVGQAFLTAHGSAPVFEHKVQTDAAGLRTACHRVTDALLGALTGRPGGFASHLVFSEPVGRASRIFSIDADGFRLREESPPNDTAIAPAFGPGGVIYYADSRDYGPFFLARGADATPVPLPMPGSVLGLGFSPDRSKLALVVMGEGTSKIWLGASDGTAMKTIASPAYASHPAIGPQGQLAYVAAAPGHAPRVHVDGKPISPAGFSASAPAFCDTPNGLLVVFAVGVGNGADILATDVRGGGLTRLTQNQGSNSYPACSPDGRLLAMFSTRKSDAGPGLYLVPLAAPWHARRITREVGRSLRWEPIEK
jgi:TolB protein